MPADPRIDRWLAKDRPWRDEMVALRALCLQAGLVEALKWRLPCYAAPGGGNVAIIQTFKAEVRLGFFKGALIDDPDGVLELPGANSRSSRQMRFRDVAAISDAAGSILTLLERAIAVERSGAKVPKPEGDPDLPAELAARFETDPAYAAAFAALTPGRRRGYVLQIGGAKNEKGRLSRVEKHRDRVVQGLGLHDR